MADLALSELRRSLARASGKKRLELILDQPDPGRLVRSLPAEDLYFTIQEIGPDDCADLVRLATPEQFRTFLDLDAWRDEAFDARRALLWFQLAGSDRGVGVQRKLAGLDTEVLALLLRGLVQIHDVDEEGEPPGDLEAQGTVERSPEGRFLLVYAHEGPEYAAARRLVHEFYEEDPYRASRMLEAMRWELESPLVEEALRWRDARLADLGFPSREDAASLYAKVDLRAPLPPRAGVPEAPPGFFLATVSRGSLLDRALEALPDDVRPAVELEAVALLNTALVADRVPVHELDLVRESAADLRRTLGLGLAHLAAGDGAGATEEKAAALLQDSALRRIFQVGFTLALQLRWRAERLAKELPVRLGGATAFLPDAPDGELLAALLGPRPRVDEGVTGGRTGRVRAFETPGELAAASAALDRIQLLGEVFLEAGLSPRSAAEAVTGAEGPAGLVRVRWADLFLTGAAREAAGAGFAFAALEARLVPEAARRAFTAEGELRAVHRELAADALARFAEQLTPAHEAAARTLATASLDRLEQELGPQVVAGGVDPKHAAPWIVST